MALLFMDGFDKYGGPSNAGPTVGAMLTAGEWSAFNTSSTLNIVAPLSATGQALSVAPNATALVLVKTLAASYPRLIGGVRFSASVVNAATGIGFADSGTTQCCVTINPSTGTISLRTGAVTGTAIATSTATVTANSTHYLEWDISFGAAAAYQVWLDGVSILSGTGNTRTTANNSANQFGFAGSLAGQTVIFDDLYLFDTSGSTNNAVLLTSPRIETTLPTSDSSVQFSIGASILGTAQTRSLTTITSAANQFYLRPFTPSRACTLSAISLMANASNAAINLRPICYTDSSGVPGTLLSTGATVTGITAGAVTTMPLGAPPTLAAGTQYWLGYMVDTALSAAFLVADTANAGRTATVTFASGAPATAPATAAGQNTVMLWGNITLTVPVNFYESNNVLANGLNYVTDSTAGHEDLYSVGNLSATPSIIYAAAVKAYCAKSDTGTRTVSMRMKSGSVDSGGSLTGQSPSTSYGWLTSLFPTDPNTGAAWTPAALNAALCGFQIDS